MLAPLTVYDIAAAEYDTLRGLSGTHEVLDQVHELGGNLHVLDLGCGTGYPIAVEVAPHVDRYMGVDISQAMLTVFHGNVPGAESRHLDHADIKSIGGAWDLIFCWGVIFDLTVEAQAVVLGACCGMLKPRGRLLCTSGREEGQTSGRVGSHTVEHLHESGWLQRSARGD